MLTMRVAYRADFHESGAHFEDSLADFKLVSSCSDYRPGSR